MRLVTMRCVESLRRTMGVAHCAARRAYTLVEMLIVIVILGIAAALVVPQMGSTDVLKAEGAVRMIVADISIVQSDAIAMQRRRAIVFNPASPSNYFITAVSGNTINIDIDTLDTRELPLATFGNAVITGTNMANNTLVFDELGSPVTGPQSDTPAGIQTIDIQARNERYRISIEAYTGRVTVTRL